MHLIGEQFTDMEDICGVQFIYRKGDHRMQLWNKNPRTDSRLRLGREIIACVGVPVKLAYTAHHLDDQSFNTHL